LSKVFKPSPESLTPSERAAGNLRYLKKAADRLERQLRQEVDVPQWVQDRIYSAASDLGMAVSYMGFESTKQEAG
jgi:hypothetical protein